MEAALRDADSSRAEGDYHAAEAYTRMSVGIHRIYSGTLDREGLDTEGRAPITVFWDEGLTDDFLAKHIGPCPVCIPNTPK